MGEKVITDAYRGDLTTTPPISKMTVVIDVEVAIPSDESVVPD